MTENDLSTRQRALAGELVKEGHSMEDAIQMASGIRTEPQASADSEQPVASDWPDNSYVYRFEYADGSAFEVFEDGRAFIVYKDGRREEKRGKIDSRIRLLVGRAVKPLHNLLRANGITGAPVRARAALPTREEVIGECLSAMPSTAEDPNESSYQRGRFDGVMEYQREIRKLSGTEPQAARPVDLEAIAEIVQFERAAGSGHYDTAQKLLEYFVRCQAVSAPLASNASDPLETLEGNCWDLRCIDIPTGGGDADIGWNIVEHHMGPPKERIVGRGRSPREALQDATSTLSRPERKP
jgi:hypothetical protein